MRKTLFNAVILAAAAMPVFSAGAALRPAPGPLTAAHGAAILTVREGNETPRREDQRADRQQDRRDDRGNDRRSSNAGPGSHREAREAGEAPRGKDGPHDRNRGDRASNSRRDSFDPSAVALTRDPVEAPRHDGREHP
jgi:hypothetical protein